MYLHLEDALVEKAKQVTWRLLAAGVCLLNKAVWKRSFRLTTVII
jgi:hypothetical protein